MNTSTGEILSWEEVERLNEQERSKFIEVKRDLTAFEKAQKQIGLYDPCACGSGKKFKFCCKRP